MGQTDYVGIDYSLGMANIDRETGIHVGVIPANEIGQAWYESSEGLYGDGDDIDEDAEPISFVYEQEGYALEQGYDDTDVWIYDSPYFTHAQYCSPCAPGAGYLLNPCPTGPKTYCLGHDWFESGKAPYPVYSVETGEEVLP